MKEYRYRYVMLGLVGVVVVLLAGCEQQRNPQQLFDLTWAGIAGVDAFHIRGQAEVHQADRAKNVQTFTYDADLQEHTRLSVQAVPVRQGLFSSAVTPLKGTGPAVMELRDGTKWVMQQEENNGSDAWTTAAAGRINPLTAIEGLRQMKKNIRLETGGARGTQVIRIEPDSEQELLRLKNDLIFEMKGIQTTWNRKTAAGENALNTKTVREGNKLIEASQRQLLQILEGAKVKTVYHLTVTKKTNLPLRLTSETRITYIDDNGTMRSETLWNDALFSNYH